MTVGTWRYQLPDEDVRVVEESLRVPCSEVHPEGAECAVCNPVMVGVFSKSPMFARERLAIARSRLGLA